jgi:ABC-type polysaccharide/polyol phosphate export permease
VVDTISAATTPLVLFSEIFFPLDDLPRLLAQSCVLLPSTQMVRLVRAVLLYGETDLLRLAPGLAILGAWTVVTYGTSLLSFKWHR